MINKIIVKRTPSSELTANNKWQAYDEENPKIIGTGKNPFEAMESLATAILFLS
jgi:hypothetical protein